jgi:uncharacterized LabA/DUF88 family protein
MKRVIFIIDGFNLYYSVKEILSLSEVCYKWLDISSLCKSYLNRYGKKDEVELVDIFYFTALKEYLRLTDPALVQRQENFIKCLEDTGLKVIKSGFKDKVVYCQAECKQKFKIYQEKETDVAIAAKLFEVLGKDLCDIVVIMTGDTDLKPAYTTAVELYPNKFIEFAFPFHRKNRALTGFKINQETYAAYPLASPYVLKDGTVIEKPDIW